MDENRRKTIAKGLIEVVDRLCSIGKSGTLNNVPLSQDIDTIVFHADFLKDMLEQVIDPTKNKREEE